MRMLSLVLLAFTNASLTISASYLGLGSGDRFATAPLEPLISAIVVGLTSNTTGVIAQELPFPANSTFFTGQPPSMVNVGTLNSSVNWPSPLYYFTFNLPKNSVESLGKITIQQQVNVETIQFTLSQTQVFKGTQNNQGPKLTAKVAQDPKTKTIEIAFDPPVPPNTTFTVGLQAVQNPSTSGVYLFTLQAFPAGKNPTAFPLSVARLQFYEQF